MKVHVVFFFIYSFLFLANECSGFTLSQKVLMTEDGIVNINDQQISPESNNQNVVRREAPEGEDYNLDSILSNSENESQSDILMEEIDDPSNSSSSEESDDKASNNTSSVIDLTLKVNVESDKVKQLPPHNPPNEKCTAPPVIGICRAAFPMFYYDPSSSTCRQFIYGGCGGNDNQYKTAEECYRICNNTITRASPRGSSTRQDYLILANGRKISELTFKSEPYAYIASNKLEEFSINKVYQFEFSLKTDRADGLIAFLRQVSVPDELQNARIQFYIYMKKGHLAVTHVFGNFSEKIVMERGGLQHGSWHHCIVSISAKTGELMMEVDNTREKFIIKALQDMPQYGSSTAMLTGFKSALWVGGIKPNQHESEDVIENQVPFHGCLDNFVLLSGQSTGSEDLTRVTSLEAAQHSGVKEGCYDLCRSQNRCDDKATCINHFDHTTCDCFGSHKDGVTCDDDEDDNILSLNAEGYVVHRLYEWMNRVQTYSTRFSISFRTGVADAILFYGSSVYPKQQYLALSILKNGSVYFEADLGDGPVSAVTKKTYNRKIWKTLTIVHRHDTIELYDYKTIYASLKLPGPTYYLHLDPDFYIGDAPLINKVCGLPVNTGRNESFCSSEEKYFYDPATQSCLTFNFTGCGGNGNNFADENSCIESCWFAGLPTLNSYQGCLRSVYYNDVSILRSLKEGKKSTSFKGLAPTSLLGNECKQKTYVPLTFSTQSSSLVLPLHEPLEMLCVKLHFRPNNTEGVLASGNVTVYDTPEQWEIQYKENYVMFYIHDELLKTKVQIKIIPAKFYVLELHCMGQQVTLIVNGKSKKEKFPGGFVFDEEIILGKGILENSIGFVGCMRQIFIKGEFIDPRTYVGTHLATKDVTLDSCRVLGPCDQPDACEHGTTCTPLEVGGVKCDCVGSGYVGKSCHFSKYKKSCEQYHVIGYSETGIYKIDLDGDGPLRPTYVRCKFDEITGEATTVVHHNLKNKYEVRKDGLKDFAVNITYRDFDDDLLLNLIDNSEYCSQRVTYDCIKAPLELSVRTWFSSPAKDYFSNFGTKKPGLCPCKERDSCHNDNAVCNCDINDNTPRQDVAIIKNREHIPLTSAVFRQTEHRDSRTDGKFSVGPLKCKREATERHVVSFKTQESFLEIPAWRKGEFDFSFKTSSSKPIIAYQPSIHPSHASFKISVVDDHTLEFMYQFGDTTGSKRIRSTKQLNNGQWQHVMVDYDQYQLRFVVNEKEEFFDFNFDAEEKLGLYDGSLFLGGVPEGYDIIGEDEKSEGFLGCIRALLMNDEVVDLKRYTRAAVYGVSSECKPACESQPCKNGATCVEHWGTYECICTNPIAHSGKNCENNLNDDAVTLTTIDSNFHYFVNTTEHLDKYSMIKNGFMGNIRTFEERGQIFFAADHLHNFVQLYLDDANTLVFKYNIKNTIHELTIVTDDDIPINKGQSNQIIVERKATSSSMSLYFDGKFYNSTEGPGISLIEEDEYTQQPFGSSKPYEQSVYYPHSYTKPSQYYMAYLGSVNDHQRDVNSILPGITGCIRGLKIGNRRWYLAREMDHASLVKPGCRMACHELKPCLNGGNCIEDFSDYTNFQCECDHTSFYGKTCAQETAYSFFGDQWIGMTSDSSPISGSFKIELAFATSYSSPRKQIVILIRSSDESTSHDYLSVNVESNGEISIEAVVSDINSEKVHGYITNGVNAHDGHRHHIIVEREWDNWILKVNGEDQEMIPMRDTYDDNVDVLVNNISLYIGGVENGIDDRIESSENFHGCISNIKLTMDDEELEILKEYSGGSKMFVQSESDKSIGPVNRCGGSFIDNPAGIVIGKSEIKDSLWFMGGEWISPEIKTSRYVKVYKEPVVKESNMGDTVPTVAGLFLALILFCVVVYLINLTIKSNKRKKQQRLIEENQPLFNGNKNVYNEDMKGDYYEKSPDMQVTVENEEKAPLMSKGAGEYVELAPIKTTPTHTETLTTTTTTTAQIESPQPEDTVIIGEPEQLVTSEAPPKPQRQLMDESFEHEKSILKTPGSQSSSDDEINAEKLPEIHVTEVADDYENGVAEENTKCEVLTSLPTEPPIDMEATTVDNAPMSSESYPNIEDLKKASESLDLQATSSSDKIYDDTITKSSEEIPEAAREAGTEIAPEACKIAPEVEEISKIVHEDPSIAFEDVAASQEIEDSSAVTSTESDNKSKDVNTEYSESSPKIEEMPLNINKDTKPQLPASPPPEEKLVNNVHDISLSESEITKVSSEPPTIVPEDKLQEDSKTQENSLDSDTPLPPPVETINDTVVDKIPPPSTEIIDDTVVNKIASSSTEITDNTDVNKIPPLPTEITDDTLDDKIPSPTEITHDTVVENMPPPAKIIDDTIVENIPPPPPTEITDDTVVEKIPPFPPIKSTDESVEKIHPPPTENTVDTIKDKLPPPPPTEITGDTIEDKISPHPTEIIDNTVEDKTTVSLNDSTKDLDSSLPGQKEAIDSALEPTENLGSTSFVDSDGSEDSIEKQNNSKEKNSFSPSSSLDEQVSRRSKKGKIVQVQSPKPVFLSEDIRSFNNPISYLGGPTILYPNEDEEDDRRDSIVSILSID